MTQPIHPMLERVARALCGAKGLDPDWDYDPKLLGGKINKRWMMFIPDARAAIQALMEPDEGMILSGKDRASFWTYIAEDVMRDAYRAMLLPLLGDGGARLC